MYELEDIINEKQPFIIDTDGKASWACKIIKQEEGESERLMHAIDEEIEILKFKKQKIKENMGNKTGYLKSLLFNYMKTVQSKELKTCYKYKLPDSELVYFKESVDYERDDEKVLSWLSKNNKFEYIKTNPSIDWAKLKKTEFLKEIDGIKEVTRPAKFEVK